MIILGDSLICIMHHSWKFFEGFYTYTRPPQGLLHPGHLRVSAEELQHLPRRILVEAGLQPRPELGGPEFHPRPFTEHTANNLRARHNTMAHAKSY